MKNNTVFVLNLNNHLCDNARDSINFACDRWNCNFYEQTENLVGNQNLCFNKLVGIKKYQLENSNVDGILYLDADILIRSDAPNPFDLFTNKNKIYAVRDCYNGWGEEKLELFKNDVTDYWLKNVHEILKWNVNIDELIDTSTNWFFNAGVFLLYPKYSRNEINCFIDNIPNEEVSGRIEQAMWNYILYVRNKTELISYEWNSLNRDVSDGMMHSYVYHFTGFDWMSLKKALPIYKWKY